MLGKCRGIDGTVVDADKSLARKLAKDNERLAAAAPELLDALKACVAELACVVERSPAGTAARALIARLEGK